MSHGVEELVDIAIGVESRSDGDEILKLNLSLSDIGRNIDLLENISASIP